MCIARIMHRDLKPGIVGLSDQRVYGRVTYLDSTPPPAFRLLLRLTAHCLRRLVILLIVSVLSQRSVMLRPRQAHRLRVRPQVRPWGEVPDQHPGQPPLHEP